MASRTPAYQGGEPSLQFRPRQVPTTKSKSRHIHTAIVSAAIAPSSTPPATTQNINNTPLLQPSTSEPTENTTKEINLSPIKISRWGPRLGSTPNNVPIGMVLTNVNQLGQASNSDAIAPSSTSSMTNKHTTAPQASKNKFKNPIQVEGEKHQTTSRSQVVSVHQEVQCPLDEERQASDSSALKEKKKKRKKKKRKSSSDTMDPYQAEQEINELQNPIKKKKRSTSASKHACRNSNEPKNLHTEQRMVNEAHRVQRHDFPGVKSSDPQSLLGNVVTQLQENMQPVETIELSQHSASTRHGSNTEKTDQERFEQSDFPETMMTDENRVADAWKKKKKKEEEEKSADTIAWETFEFPEDMNSNEHWVADACKKRKKKKTEIVDAEGLSHHCISTADSPNQTDIESTFDTSAFSKTPTAVAATTEQALSVANMVTESRSTKQKRLQKTKQPGRRNSSTANTHQALVSGVSSPSPIVIAPTQNTRPNDSNDVDKVACIMNAPIPRKKGRPLIDGTVHNYDCRAEEKEEEDDDADIDDFNDMDDEDSNDADDSNDVDKVACIKNAPIPRKKSQPIIDGTVHNYDCRAEEKEEDDDDAEDFNDNAEYDDDVAANDANASISLLAERPPGTPHLPPRPRRDKNLPKCSLDLIRDPKTGLPKTSRLPDNTFVYDIVDCDPTFAPNLEHVKEQLGKEVSRAMHASHVSDHIAVRINGSMMMGKGFSKRMSFLEPLMKAVFENSTVPRTKKGLEDLCLLVFYSGDDRDDLIATDNKETMIHDEIVVNGKLVKLLRRHRRHRDIASPIGRRIYPLFEGFRCVYHYGRTKQFTFTCGGKMFSIPIHHNQLLLMGEAAAGISSKMFHCVHDEMDCFTIQFNLYFMLDGQGPEAFLNALRCKPEVSRLMPYSSAQNAAFREMFNQVVPKRIKKDEEGSQTGTTPFNPWRRYPYTDWKDSENDHHVPGECSVIEQKRLGFPNLQAARKQQEEDNYPNLQAQWEKQRKKTIQRNLTNGLVLCSDPTSIHVQCRGCNRTRTIAPVMLFDGRIVVPKCAARNCSCVMRVANMAKRKQVVQVEVNKALEKEKKFFSDLTVNAANSLGDSDVVLDQCYHWRGNRKYRKNVIDIVGKHIKSLQTGAEKIKTRVAKRIIDSVGRFVELSEDGEGWEENDDQRDEKVKSSIKYEMSLHG